MNTVRLIILVNKSMSNWLEKEPAKKGGKMKTLFIILSAAALTVTTFLLAFNDPQIPKGWFAAGSNPSEYEMGTDNSVFQNGKLSAFIKSKNPKAADFGTLMQNTDAENYLNKRLRLSGYLKCENVESWSGMWMRIDGENGKQLGFDNMFNRAITGTVSWKNMTSFWKFPLKAK